LKAGLKISLFKYLITYLKAAPALILLTIKFRLKFNLSDKSICPEEGSRMENKLDWRLMKGRIGERLLPSKWQSIDMQAEETVSKSGVDKIV